MINSPVQKIKERLTIEEVVSSYIPLIKVGNSLKAKCPFHNEKTPSFFISTERNSYYCFGCSKGGDIFSFVQEFEGLDFRGSLKLLAERAGVSLNDVVEDNSDREKLYKVMEDATSYFENNLNQNLEVKKYLKDRGLEDKTIVDFRLGFALNNWRELTNFLHKKGYTFEIIEKAGLAKKKDETKKVDEYIYDRFRSRIMFPIADSSKRIIAFSGRYFEQENENKNNSIVPAKYLNSPETPIFSKSAVLYGLDKAKEYIRKNNFSILVEGQMDLLLSHQAGFRNTVATSGTAVNGDLTDKDNNVSNLGLVRRLSKNIIMSFDGDEAGLRATERASKIALSLDMDVKIANLPKDLDPADLILKNGVEEWKKVIKNSKHIIQFILDDILENHAKDIRKSGQLIRGKVLPYLLLLQSDIDVNFFLNLISKKSDIPIEALRSDLSKIKEEQNNIFKNNEVINPFIKENQKSDTDKERNTLAWLIGIIFLKKENEENDLELQKIIKHIQDIFNINLDEILDKLKFNKEELVFRVEDFYSNKEPGLIYKDALELLKELKIIKLEQLAEEQRNDLNNPEILKSFNLTKIQIEDIRNGRFNF
jgi:DNA primase